MLDITGNHYVVVIENDCQDIDPHEPKGPIVWETYLGENSTLESAMEREKNLSRYGKRRICKLIPIDVEKESARQLLDYASKLGCVEELKKMLSILN